MYWSAEACSHVPGKIPTSYVNWIYRHAPMSTAWSRQCYTSYLLFQKEWIVKGLHNNWCFPWLWKFCDSLIRHRWVEAITTSGFRSSGFLRASAHCSQRAPCSHWGENRSSVCLRDGVGQVCRHYGHRLGTWGREDTRCSDHTLLPADNRGDLPCPTEEQMHEFKTIHDTDEKKNLLGNTDNEEK